MNGKNREVKAITGQMEPKILAISGAGEILLAVLCEGESGHNYQAHKQALQHNEHIVGLCDALCSQAGVTAVSQLALDAVAIDLGPGSFTGQRISMSFAKGVSAAIGKPLLGFSTFELWLELFRSGENCRCSSALSPLLVLIDGRKRRFYANLYVKAQSVACWDLSSRGLGSCIVDQWGEELVRNLSLSGPSAVLFLEELASLSNLPSRADTGEILQKTFEAWLSCHLIPSPDFAAIAEQVARLAYREYCMQNFLQLSDGPLYLRKSDAEEQAVKGSTESM